MATAMIVAVAMGSRFINWIRAKQGRGQPIREDGPVSHLSKVGTPTMGGLMILAGIGVAVFLWGDLTNPYIWIVSGVTAAFGVLGFIDDYAKVTKQTSAGLTSKQKLSSMPEVISLADAGLPGYNYASWSGLFGPAGMPPEVTRRLSQAFTQAVTDPANEKFLADLGMITTSSSPESFQAFVQEQIKLWGRLTKEAGLTPL